MANIGKKGEDSAMDVVENPDASLDTQNENEITKSATKEEMKVEENVEQAGDEHTDEIIEEDEMEESEEIEEKPAIEKTNETTGTVNAYAITKVVQEASSVDIGKCMIMSGLPSSLYDDDDDIFNECIISMLEEDFTVKKDSIASITRLLKGEDEENGCRVMVLFKTRVHKHRVMAVKNRSNVGYSLEQVETVPPEVADLLKEIKKGEEKDTHDVKEGIKKEEEKKEEKFKDEHSTLPFVIDWDGAPEFQWKIPEGKGGTTLVIENADTLDLYEPFLYRASLKAQSVSVRMPGRIIEDQPTAKHYGTISLQFLNDGEAIRYAMVNLIYFRSKGDRRIKVYLPQTIVALKRKSEFEKRLGRKIAYPEAMRKIMVKSTDLSLAECTFGMDEAKAVFPHREIESVERITDSNEKVGFVITFKCAHDTVIAHASTRSVKVGDINCRIYMLGSECNGTERQGKEYLTRMEVITQNKEDQIKKKKEYDEKVAKGEIVPTVKKTFPKKTTGSSTLGLRKTRGPLPVTTTKSIPLNKTNGPSFKQPMGSVRGARSNTYPQRMNTSPRGPPPLSVSSSSRGRIGRPRRDDDQGGNRSRGGLSPWMENGRRSGGAPPLSSSAFNKDDIRMEQMVREQRRQMDMQERLLRQQEMITVMNDRLHQPVLSSSAFRQRDHELSASQSAFDGRSGYGVAPSINYNKTSGYTPSPAYEPLTATMTPSHLSNPAQDTYLSPAYGSSAYGKPSSSSFPSSSSYRDHRY